MSGRALILLSLILACILGVSCQQIRPPARAELQLSSEVLKAQNSIPLEYGNLVGVAVDSPGYARLFFEKPDKTIIVVTVNVAKGILQESMLVIPRK